MKRRHLPLITALAAVLVAGVVAGSGSAGTNGIATSKVVFASVDDVDGMVDVFAADVDGTNKVNISHDPGTRTDATPEWSSDGTLVAFARYDGSGSSIMVAEGTKLTNLTPRPTRGVSNVDPSWSPDGTSIVFASNRDGNFDLYVVNTNGSGLRKLTKSDGSIQNLEPDWSPVGSTIVFSRSGGDVTRNAPGLFAVKAGGGAVRRLTATTTLYGDPQPEWSPDGSTIVFTSARHRRNIDLYLLHPSLKGLDRVQRITTNKSYDGEATWAPDGSGLVFVSDRTGATEFFSLNFLALSPGEFPQTQLTCDGVKKSAPDLTGPVKTPGTGPSDRAGSGAIPIPACGPIS